MNAVWNYFFPQPPTTPEEQNKQAVDTNKQQSSSGSSSSSSAPATQAPPQAKPAVQANIVFDIFDWEITREEVVGVPESFMLHNVLTAKECEQIESLIKQIGMYALL